MEALTGAMQVDLGTVMGVVGTAAATVVAGYVTLIRYIWDTKDKEHNRRIEELEARARSTSDEVKKLSALTAEEVKTLTARLHAEEKQSIGIEGKLLLAQSANNDLSKDVEAIKRDIVPRAEWEHRMGSQDKALSNIERTMRPPPYSSRYTSTSDTTMPAVKPPR